MDTSIISQIYDLCIFPLIGLLSAYIIRLISAKLDEFALSRESKLEQKYIGMLDDTITKCTIATTQTYVDALKKQGAFDAEAQKEAFKMTYDAVLQILTAEATQYLNAAVGDLNLYITQKIEAEVKLNK